MKVVMIKECELKLMIRRNTLDGIDIYYICDIGGAELNYNVLKSNGKAYITNETFLMKSMSEHTRIQSCIKGRLEENNIPMKHPNYRKN